jgi:EAL domain-containing protein (putative c-di-GMP-specific phosphodiesterase class I)/GGDEF domain-containing protein
MLRLRLDQTISAGTVDATFQPIVDLKRCEIAGFETLTRLTDSDGFRGPAELFDAAEKVGSLWELEALTRRVCLNAAAEWPQGAKLFLNTSPQVFADKRFGNAVLEMVRKTPGLIPARVVLEITERSDRQHLDGLAEQVRIVKAAGFEIAIDDVGAGTSGLNRIMALRPHWLKLDRELVTQIHRDRVRQNLIRFFLRFATLSGVKLIAEGIERKDELETLMDLGVIYAQGFFLGRPGARNQALSREVRDFVLSRRVGGPIGHRAHPNTVSVARYARPVYQADARDRVVDVASDVLRDPRIPGALVVEGDRPVGWCDRETLLRSATESRGGQVIGFLVRPGIACAPPEATIPDALELASGREETNIGVPLIVADENGIVGSVSLGDLLHAAADLARDVQLRIAPLTGLPGRVRADEHLTKLLDRRPLRLETQPAPIAECDAALINIRSFARYNEVMGYELGDELLRRVVELFRENAMHGRESVFFAHLGDDRFLATAPAGTLRTLLENFLAAFDASEQASVAEGSNASEFLPRLHVVLVANATRWITSPQMLYRLGDLWKRRPFADSAPSELTVVTERSDVLRFRASA